MGGVGLGQHVAEADQPRLLHQERGGRPVVAVELPVERPRSLAHHQDIDFAQRVGSFGPGLEPEVARGLGITGGPLPAVDRLREVVGDVEGPEVVLRAVGRILDPGADHRSAADQQHERRPPQAPAPERVREPVGQPRRNHPEDQGRHVEGHDPHDGRDEFPEQLHRLAGVGGGHVQEHVDGDDRVAEQVEQHQLKSPENKYRQEAPQRQTGPPPQGEQTHPHAARHEQQSRLAEPRHRLGDAQKQVRHQQHRHEHRVVGALVGPRPPQQPSYQLLKTLH